MVYDNYINHGHTFKNSPATSSTTQQNIATRKCVYGNFQPPTAFQPYQQSFYQQSKDTNDRNIHNHNCRPNKPYTPIGKLNGM